jgi:hypothetical protein
VIGTFANVVGIVAGGLIGRRWPAPPSAYAQQRLRVLLGGATILFGFHIVWKSLGGSFGRMLSQVALAVLALVIGRLIGRALRLQKRLNRVGQFARERLQAASAGHVAKGASFNACTGLFCLTPLAILGPLQEGLTGDFRLLLVKAAMEGLAMQMMVRQLGPASVAAGLPVLVFQGTLTLGMRALQPALQAHAMAEIISTTIGLLATAVAMMILEIHKITRRRPIEMADYLPSLFVAPLLAWWWW